LGEILRDADAPNVSGVTYSTSTVAANTPPAPGSGAVISTGTYRYKITFVDANGNESRDSDPITVPLSGTDNTITLSSLPAVRAPFTAMRIYRTLANRPFDYSLVGVVPSGAAANPFVDVPVVTTVSTPDVGSRAPTGGLAAGSMVPGNYQYKLVVSKKE